MTVDIYDMGDNLNAFGVFQPEGTAKRLLGTSAQALLVPTTTLLSIKIDFMLRSKLYHRKKCKARGKGLASMVAAHLPGDDSLPHELSYFPEKKELPVQSAISGAGYSAMHFWTGESCAIIELKVKKSRPSLPFSRHPGMLSWPWNTTGLFWKSQQKHVSPLKDSGSTVLFQRNPFTKPLS